MLVGVVEQDELELGAGQRDEPELGHTVELVLRIVRGDGSTGAWSASTRSHWIITVAGRCGSSRMVS